MDRRILIGSAILFAIAALEFGLLGAGAAGLGGGRPAATHPGAVPQTATPTSTPTPSIAGCVSFDGQCPTVPPMSPPACPPLHLQALLPPAEQTAAAGEPISPPCATPPVSSPPQQTPISPPAACAPGGPGDPACFAHSIELSATPDELFCDGNASTRLDVHLRKADGSDVADGATVVFSTYYSPASLTPAVATTTAGTASTLVRFGPSLFVFSPSVEVRVSAGLLDASLRIPCSPDSPVTPPPCPPGGIVAPGNTAPVSPPCAPTATPIACSGVLPFGAASTAGLPLSPPCATATPCDPSTPPCAPPTPSVPGIGGELSIGTPSLVGGKIDVPILTSAPVDPYESFTLSLAYDTGLLSFSSVSAGDALTSIAGAFCVAAPPDAVPGGIVVGCSVEEPAGSRAAGTIAVIALTPLAPAGCTRLHLKTFGPPDDGGHVFGSYSLGIAHDIQQNTYGPDVGVDLADGSICDASGGGGPQTSTPSPTATPSVPTATSTPSFASCPDLNDDGQVTAVDVLIELREARTKNAPAPYDLNRDGRVDGKDVIIVARQLGRRC